MRVEVKCPGCAKRTRFAAGEPIPPCSGCGRVVEPAGRVAPSAVLNRCMMCDEPRLFRQKDFNRKVGAAVVLAGAAVSLAVLPFSPLAAYLVLFGWALLDVVFYRMLPEVAICYRCGAGYRGHSADSKLQPFDLLTAELVDHQVREEGTGQAADRHM